MLTISIIAEFTPVTSLSLDHSLLTPWGVNKAQLLQESKPITLLEITRSLSECTLLIIITVIGMSSGLQMKPTFAYQNERKVQSPSEAQAPQAHNAIIYHLVREFNGEKS